MKFDSDTRFKKDFNKLTDKILETGEVDLKDADFDYLPTLRCNLNCKHCRQAELRPQKEWTEIKNEMTMDQIREAWDNIDVKGKIVKINGGEPFVKKEMFEIFDYFKDRGAYNIVSTNGLIFKDPQKIELLREKGLVEIDTSIDGIGKIHDEVRGFPDLFNHLTNFIKEMSRDHKVLVESCVQKLNVKQLPKILQLKKELGFYKIKFQLPVFTTITEIENASRMMGEKLQYESQLKTLSRYDFSFEDLFKSWGDMILTNESFDMHPKFFGSHQTLPLLCYNRTVRNTHRLLCTYMFRSKIDPNGDVRFCPYIVKSFGNIQKDNFEEVWNSKEFKEFRMKILKNNMLPSCENCPHLRLYNGGVL